MCGRYSATNPARLRAAFHRFRFSGAAAAEPARYNIAPTQPVLAVRNDGNDTVEAMIWGLVPAWSRDPNIGSKLINARVETLAEKPAFRDALRRRRCILFADGFYEWHAKRPVRFTLEDEAPFAFAGLWEAAPRGGATCTIVTCEANEIVRPVHGRMPVILTEDALEPWLTPGDLTPAAATALLGPYDPAHMRAQPASTRLNDARYDAHDVLDANEPLQPPLGF
jgi:putative SOS response-associated peptidase YedK